jgi:hypothetical protein
MTWIHRINQLPVQEKEGLYRILIPPSLYARFQIHPLSFSLGEGQRAVRIWGPPGDKTALVEIKLPQMEEPLYSIQISDTQDFTQLDWDFLIVNDPRSPRFLTQVDSHGRDTLFGWASRNLEEEIKAMEAGLCPGQSRKGLGLTREAVECLEFFCRILDIRTIRLEALFYHNAITYERHGFSYFSGYPMMRSIHKEFLPGGKLYALMNGSTPFRRPEMAQTVRGRSWAIHDGILLEVEDELLGEGWSSPVMYRMVGKPRAMPTFPDPVY